MKILLSIAVLSLAPLSLISQDKPVESPQAHFHHLHLNVVDPAASANFYTSKFDCEKANFAGKQEAVWAQKSWLLFNKVKTSPQRGNKPDLTSAIWHMGWGAENMKETYQKQLEMGTKFFEPLTDISDIGGQVGARDTFYYCYVQSPDHALIELNTARHHQFGHLHLFSADPISAAEWWGKYFGVKLSPALKNPNARKQRVYRGFPIGPSASFMVDNVNVIIFPIEYPQTAYPDQWKDRTSFDSTKGKSIDHIALSVDNLAETMKRMKADQVKILQDSKPIPGTKIKSAFIEGPDKIVFELVEGHANKEQMR
ncbi:MAG: VOC family protein [Acidobacteria bacterium]|nr:VOC family protein [Acidobacteriota bacterium]